MDCFLGIKKEIIIIGVYLIIFIFPRALNLFSLRQSSKVNIDSTNFSFLKNSIFSVIYTAELIAIFFTPPIQQRFIVYKSPEI
jgi:hypothetical protein